MIFTNLEELFTGKITKKVEASKLMAGSFKGIAASSSFKPLVVSINEITGSHVNSIHPNSFFCDQTDKAFVRIKLFFEDPISCFKSLIYVIWTKNQESANPNLKQLQTGISGHFCKFNKIFNYFNIFGMYFHLYDH
jgi:hypothetical protein